MKEATEKLLERLWSIGQPLEGPIRVVVEPGSGVVDGPAPETWSLGRDVGAIVRPNEGYAGGASGLLIEGPDTAVLRAWRTQYQSGAKGHWWLTSIPVRRAASGPGPLEYLLHFRDVVPFEDEKGRLSLQW
jgi:hypothetical protein